ncbi:unnamed protein product, partial [Rotaria socialis]
MVKQSTKNLFYNYKYPRNGRLNHIQNIIHQIMVVFFLPKMGKLLVSNVRSKHEKQRNSNKVLDDALKNVSDDDKDDDKDDDDDDEHEYLTSDNRTLSRVTTADRFLSSPFVYSSFEQNVATAGSFQFSN